MKVLSIEGFKLKKNLPLDLFSASVSAGFPSPAENFIERKIDLNEELIENPAATFFVRVEGDSMVDAGILSGDILVVDRSKKTKDKDIVVAVIDGEFTVKRIRKKATRYFLVPENANYQAIEITKEMECQIWGVVRYAIHSL